jgi:hypothetical protein
VALNFIYLEFYIRWRSNTTNDSDVWTGYNAEFYVLNEMDYEEAVAT